MENKSDRDTVVGCLWLALGLSFCFGFSMVVFFGGMWAVGKFLRLIFGGV
jgi:hypothetical protein